MKINEELFKIKGYLERLLCFDLQHEHDQCDTLMPAQWQQKKCKRYTGIQSEQCGAPREVLNFV